LIRRIKKEKERFKKTERCTAEKSPKEDRQEVNTNRNSRRRQTGSKHEQEQQKKTG